MRLNADVRSMTGHMKGLPHMHERIIMHQDQGRRESRGGLGKIFLIICVRKVELLIRRVCTRQRVCLH